MPSKEELEKMLRRAFAEMGVTEPTEEMMRGLTTLVYRESSRRIIVEEKGTVISIDIYKKDKSELGPAE